MTEKSELRNKVLAARDLLSPQEQAEKSSLIKSQLSKLPEYQVAKTILFYYSFGSEVETISLIEEAISQRKTVALPLTLPKNKELLALKIKSLNQGFKRGPLGIREPIKERAEEIRPEDIDLVIVPGVAFDLEGWRLGRGAGYYDRFLKKIKATILRIALAFEVQIVEKIPVSEHDMKVDRIITEERVINC